MEIRTSIRLMAPVCAVVAIATVTGPARAQDPPPPPASSQGAASAPSAGRPLPKAPRLVYSRGPVQCLPEEEFRSEVAIALDGSDHFDPEGGGGVVRVWFEKIPGGFRGTVEFTNPAGQKETHPPETKYNCELLARSMAYLAARHIPKELLFDPCAGKVAPPAPAEVVTRPAEPPPPSPAAWAPPPLPSQVFPPVKVEPSCWDSFEQFEQCTGMDLSIGLSALALMTIGWADNVSPGLGLGVEFRGMPPSWGGDTGLSLGLEFRALPPAHVTVRQPIDPTKATYPQSLNVIEWTGLVVPCFRFAKYFSACGVGLLGGIERDGVLQEDTEIILRLGPRLGFEIPFAERFAVFGFGEVLFNWLGGGVDFAEPGVGDPQGPPLNVTWEAPAVAGFLGVGASVKFE